MTRTFRLALSIAWVITWPSAVVDRAAAQEAGPNAVQRDAAAASNGAKPTDASAPTNAVPSNSAAPTTPGPTGPQTPSTEYDAERMRIWNSPQMMEARRWVREYSRRSVQFTPEDADAYLARLKQLSPQQMQEWLKRYEARQASIARSHDVARSARQQAIDRARAWQDGVRQSYAQIQLGQEQAALMARSQHQQQQFAASQRAADIEAERSARVASRLDNDFSWFLFPTPYQQRAFAAALPGDLPPGDPRNFIRGDVPGPGEGRGVVEANPRGDGVGPEAAADVAR